MELLKPTNTGFIFALFNTKSKNVLLSYADNISELDALYLIPLKNNSFINNDIQQIYNSNKNNWKTQILYNFTEEINNTCELAIKEILFDLYVKSIIETRLISVDNHKTEIENIETIQSISYRKLLHQLNIIKDFSKKDRTEEEINNLPIPEMFFYTKILQLHY
jgi:hypothetical protein